MLSLDGWIDANTLIAITVQSESMSKSGDFGVVMTENEPDPVTITVRTLCMRDHSNITSQLPHWFNNSQGYGYPWDMASWGTLFISIHNPLCQTVLFHKLLNFHKSPRNFVAFYANVTFEVNFLGTVGAWMKSLFAVVSAPSIWMRVHYRYF